MTGWLSVLTGVNIWMPCPLVECSVAMPSFVTFYASPPARAPTTRLISPNCVG